jgi:hypothetical protein|tara:strand:+ start:136 stop:612 length:477 start_codon:yes stop_codon:yes gene_type:complete
MSKAMVATVMMGVGTAISAYGAYQQGKMQKQLNDYNAKVAMQNKIAVAEKAEYDKEQLKRRVRKLKGSTTVAFAKAGVDGTEGTAIDIFEELAIESEKDLLMIQYNADLKARGYEIEAQTASYTGAMAYKAGKMRAASTLLTGGSSTYKYGQETGAFA